MTTRWRIVKLGGVAASALAVVAAAIAAYAAADAAKPASLLSPMDAAVVALAYTVTIGGLAVALIGVPIYCWLERQGWNRTPQTVALGSAPGLAALPVDVNLATVSVVCGVAIALVTHAWASRNPGA